MFEQNYEFPRTGTYTKPVLKVFIKNCSFEINNNSHHQFDMTHFERQAHLQCHYTFWCTLFKKARYT